MRAIEYLIQLFPEKTGKELLEIQAQDKIEDQKKYDERNKLKLAFINDINTNGGYYRGRFGIDQYFYYRVFNLILDNAGEILMDVENITLFINNDCVPNQVTQPGRVNLERRIETCREYDTYGLDYYERVTVKEWNEVNDYINNMTEFWKTIKPV